MSSRRFIKAFSRQYNATPLCNCKPSFKQSKFIHQSAALYSSWFFGNGNGLRAAINGAETFVGYPTTYSSLKFLVDEEPANFIGLAKKLVGSGHPLLSTARDLLSQDTYSSHHLGGLWVLLLSKAAGKSDTSELLEEDFIHGIHKNQRLLAETTELIHTAYLIHRSMLDITNSEYMEDINEKTLNFGNKLSVLGGDFLLGKASLQLARLNNTDVVELMSKVIGDMAEGSMLDIMAKDSLSIDVKEWEDYVYLMQGSLMANSCKAAVVLTGHPTHIQEQAFEFGKNLHFAQKCYKDIKSFQNKKVALPQTNLVLLLSLQSSKPLREKYNWYLEHETSVSLSKELRYEIESEIPDITEQVHKLWQRYTNECKTNIHLFHGKETVDVISSILDKICES